MSRIGFGCLVCTLMLGSFPQHGAAQRPGQQRSAAAIVEIMRAGGQPSGLHRILRQIDGPQPRARLDSISRGMAEAAMDLPRTADGQLRAGAIAALFGAVIRSDMEGEPFMPAISHLRMVIFEGRNRTARSMSLTTLAWHAPRDTSLAILREAATLNDSVAFSALDILVGELGDAGLDMVRELYMQGLVVDPSARRLLNWMAQRNGWNRLASSPWLETGAASSRGMASEGSSHRQGEGTGFFPDNEWRTSRR
jgi:hypothetical protein